jgi:hypothetical protein
MLSVDSAELSGVTYRTPREPTGNVKKDNLNINFEVVS